MIRVGIGGWTYEPWRGSFFPPGLPHAKELGFAARALTSIEINGTFYRTQKPDTFRKWADETPDGFVFSVKAPRYAVNKRVLAEAGPSIERFVESGLDQLGDKLGPILWQFAPTKKFDAVDFAAFLALLPHEAKGKALRHALEVRHESFRTPQFYDIARKKPDAELVADLDAAAAWAKAQGGDVSRLGIIGFCRGGRAVWVYAAHNDALKAGVAFYGSLVDPKNPVWPKSALELAPEIKAPVLGLYGEADQGIPVSQVEAMKAALAAAGKTADFKIYEGAPHGFHADYRPSYRHDAAEDAWTRAIAWFKTYGVLS